MNINISDIRDAANYIVNLGKEAESKALNEAQARFCLSSIVNPNIRSAAFCITSASVLMATVIVVGKSAKLYHGGAAFVWPIIQGYEFLSMKPMQIDCKLTFIAIGVQLFNRHIGNDQTHLTVHNIRY